MRRGFVYILKSGRNYRYYVGSTDNLERRLKEHNRGKSLYTRNTGPWRLVFNQEFDNLDKARSVEYKLKKLASRDVIEKIIRQKIIKLGA